MKSHLPSIVGRNADDSNLRGGSLNVKCHCSCVKKQISSVRVVGGNLKDIHVDNAVTVEVNSNMYVEIQCDHVCKRVFDSRERP